MTKLITKARMYVAVLLAASSMALVTACDEVDDPGQGQVPEQQPMQ